MNQAMTAGIEDLPAIAQRMAEYGRGSDKFLAHLAPDETVIPRPVLDAFPQLRESLFEHMRQMGTDPERYVVGSGKNSINPATGLPEFDWIRDIQRGLKGVVKSVAPVVLPFVVNAVFPNLGPVLSGALGAGIGSLVGGGRGSDALKAAALGGVAGGVFSGLQAGFGGTEGTFGSRFTEGVAQPFRDLGASISNTMQSPFTAVPATPAAQAPAVPATPAAQAPAAQAQPGFFDRATSFFTPKAGPTLPEALSAVSTANPSAGEATKLALAQEYMKKNSPGFLSNYGPLLALGGIGAYAAGAFDQPKPQAPADFFGGKTGTGLLAQSPERYRLGVYRGPSSMNLPPLSAPGTAMLAEGGSPTAFPRRTGGISGPGTETSDSIPAMLSDGEFVMTAKAVRGAGNGSRREGMKTMYEMMRRFEGNAR